MNIEKINNYIKILFLVATMLISCGEANHIELDHENDTLVLKIKINSRLNNKGFLIGIMEVKNKTNKPYDFNINDIIIRYNDIRFSVYRDSIASLYYVINIEPLSYHKEQIYLAEKQDVKRERHIEFNENIFQMNIKNEK